MLCLVGAEERRWGLASLECCCSSPFPSRLRCCNHLPEAHLHAVPLLLHRWLTRSEACLLITIRRDFIGVHHLATVSPLTARPCYHKGAAFGAETYCVRRAASKVWGHDKVSSCCYRRCLRRSTQRPSWPPPHLHGIWGSDWPRQSLPTPVQGYNTVEVPQLSRRFLVTGHCPWLLENHCRSDHVAPYRSRCSPAVAISSPSPEEKSTDGAGEEEKNGRERWTDPRPVNCTVGSKIRQQAHLPLGLFVSQLLPTAWEPPLVNPNCSRSHSGPGPSATGVLCTSFLAHPVLFNQLHMPMSEFNLKDYLTSFLIFVKLRTLPEKFPGALERYVLWIEDRSWGIKRFKLKHVFKDIGLEVAKIH